MQDDSKGMTGISRFNAVSNNFEGKTNASFRQVGVPVMSEFGPLSHVATASRRYRSIVLLSFLLTVSLYPQHSYKTLPAADKRFETGLQYYQTARYAEAATEFAALLSAKSTHQYTTASYVMAAKSYMRMNDYDRSIAVLSKFLATYPSSRYHDNARYTLGVAYLLEHKFGEAALRLFETKEYAADTVTRTHAVELLKFLADGNITFEELQKFPPNQAASRTKEYVTYLLADRQYEKGEFETARVLADSLVASHLTPEITHDAFVLRAKIAKGVNVRVGVLLPLFRTDSAPEKSLAEEMLNGIRYALEEKSATLPEGMKIDLDVRDTERDNELAKKMLTELSQRKNTVGVIGPMFSPMAFGCAPVAAAEKIPLISPTANAPGIARLNPYMFQLNPDLSLHGRALARYAVTTLGLKTLAIVAPSDTSLRPLVEEFYKEAIRDGARIVTVEIYNSASGDLDEHFLKLRKAGLGGEAQISFAAKMKPQIFDSLRSLGISQWTLDSLRKHKSTVSVFRLLGPYGGRIADSLGLPVSYPAVNAKNLNESMNAVDGLFLPIVDADDISTILSQLAYYNIKTQILGSAEWYNVSALESNKQTAKGVVFCSDTYVEKETPGIKRFGELYFGKMGKSPTRYTMFGYDAMDILLGMFAKRITSREQLTAALQTVETFHGFHSSISLDSTRVNSILNMLQYREGGIRKIGEVSAR